MSNFDHLEFEDVLKVLAFELEEGTKKWFVGFFSEERALALASVADKEAEVILIPTRI